MNFRDALISIYRQNPCQVLPNALWKTLARLDDLQTSVKMQAGRVVRLMAWGENSLLVCWARNRHTDLHLSEHRNALNLALVHQDFMRSSLPGKFAVHQPYFRLIHRPENAGISVTVPAGFSIADVNLPGDAQEAAELIGHCYQDIHPTAETVRSWMEHAVFDPSLWVWVIDDQKGIPAGLGIAEVDHTVREGSLEWVQVLPAYQKKGLGKCIVGELLARLEKRAAFTTVAGEADGDGHIEAFYRSCGFAGEDIWWVLRN